MPAPLLLIPAAGGAVAKGVAMLGAALGLTSKAIVLSTVAFKTAAIGTAFIIKGVTFTKTGFLAMTVVTGGLAYADVTNSTVETMVHLDYSVGASAELPIIKEDIENEVKSGGSYTVRYCQLPTGEKQALPKNYNFCPHDGSAPLNGHKFDFEKSVAQN